MLPRRMRMLPFEWRTRQQCPNLGAEHSHIAMKEHGLAGSGLNDRLQARTKKKQRTR
jgi:hypothetical protein